MCVSYIYWIILVGTSVVFGRPQDNPDFASVSSAKTINGRHEWFIPGKLCKRWFSGMFPLGHMTFIHFMSWTTKKGNMSWCNHSLMVLMPKESCQEIYRLILCNKWIKARYIVQNYPKIVLIIPKTTLVKNI